MKASDLFVKALENEGVEYIFGIPGEENLDILDSIRASKKIKLILTRHEQAAGFMAATWGRLSGTPGVCLSTLGPGLTNFVTSTAYADLGAMPVIFISGQKPILASKQGKFQIIDAIKMMTPITKKSHQIINADAIPGIVREAFRIAREERPGPVHLELPEDIAGFESNHHIYDVVDGDTPDATEQSIETAVRMIEEAQMPVILIGSNANRKAAELPLLEFIEKTKIPFFTTQMGKGIVDERHPCFFGTAALSDSDILHRSIDKSDVIINIGHDTIEKPPYLMAFGKFHKRKIIHINFNAAEIDDIYFPHHLVLGNIATSIKRMAQSVRVQGHWDFSYCKETQKETFSHVKPYLEDSSRFPLLPLRIVTLMRNIIPDDGIVCLDNGMYKIWFARNYKAYQQHTLLLDNALASMGAGLPSAIAAKLKKPAKKVIAVCGDGGFMMNSQELETVVRLGLDLTVIVLNDESYGMIRWKQEKFKFEDWGLKFGNPDFVKYVESYGGTGHRPKSDAEFSQALETCINGKGLHLIDIAVDYTMDKQILSEIKDRDVVVPSEGRHSS